MTTSTERLLGVIWGDRTGYVFLPHKDATADGYPRRGWHETAGFPYQGQVPDLQSMPAQADLYFCPTVFSEPKRRKEFALPTNVLWSDLDPVHPDSCLIRPSVAWESSPGRYQALWFLDQEVEPETAAELSKRIAYTDGGDKGGWDLTQVLRIPGTANFKYPSKPPGRLLWAQRRPISLEFFQSTYPELAPREPDTGETGGEDASHSNGNGAIWTPATQLSIQTTVQSLPLGLQKRLLSTPPPGADRSTELQRLSRSLLKLQISPSIALGILQLSSWNKFAGRSDEQQQLRKQLTDARSVVLQSAKKSAPAAPSTQELLSGSATELASTTSTSLMEMRVHTWSQFLTIPTQLRWLVEDTWVDRTVGFISGRSKSYKTWIALDLALSVLSGKPFLDRFGVLRTGRVLLIQEEDPTAILQQRLELISKSKGMSPTIDYLNGDEVLLNYPTFPLEIINLQGFSLTDTGKVAELRRRIAKFQPDLIILDPLIVMMNGVKENIATEVAPILQEVKYWREDFRCNVIIVHHWNKTKTEETDRGGAHLYGSFAFHAWLESAMHIEPIIDPESTKIDTVVMEREFKAAPGERALRLRFDINTRTDFVYGVHHEAETISSIGQKLLDILGQAQGWMTTGELTTLSGYSRQTVATEAGKLTRMNKIDAQKGGGRGKQSGFKIKHHITS